MGNGIRRLGLGAALAALLAAGLPQMAEAGCGCTKPAPAPAQVRPAATYAEMEVTVFHPDLEPGASYEVTFVPAAGGEAASVSGTVALRRDLSDGAIVPQLAVPLPVLPLGPAEIRVADSLGDILLVADDAQFTVAPEPVAIPTTPSVHRFPDYQAAVTRDGVVLISLDFSDVQHARVFRAQALGHPLRFGRDDLTFWNAQGFLMQRLDESIPGLFALDAGSDENSDTLHYSRHEFNTYLLQHDERKMHEVEPTDSSWHTDGSAHIDHDHQILHMAATLPGGGLPASGATPPFELVIDTYSLFHHGLFAENDVWMDHGSQTDSFDSHAGIGTFGESGDVLSNGTVEVKNGARIDGKVTAPLVSVASGSSVSGEIAQSEPTTLFLGVDVPAGLEPLGDVQLHNGEQLTLGRGSYHASRIDLSNEAVLLVDNSEGPVTIYVSGSVRIDSYAEIRTTTWDPERFALYVAGSQNVNLANEGGFYGVVYAPDSFLELDNGAKLYGSFVAGEIKADNGSSVHYDVALRGMISGGRSDARAYDAAPIEIGSDIDITDAEYKNRRRRGKVRVLATSSSGDSVPLRISIAGFVEDAPMTWSARHARWKYRAHTKMELDGALVTISSGDGSIAEANLE